MFLKYNSSAVVKDIDKSFKNLYNIIFKKGIAIKTNKNTRLFEN